MPVVQNVPDGWKIFLTVEEAAARLCLGRTTVYALIKSRAIGSVLVGRSRRVPVSEVEAYATRLVAEQCVEPLSIVKG